MSGPEKQPKWEVGFTSAAARQKRKLPMSIAEALARLIGDMEQRGPIQKQWPHFSSLKKGRGIPENAYHCHIKTGRPTYVACWEINNKKIRIIKVFYVGTHENAPY